MPPPARPLPDDLIPDILVQISPDDPAGVVRAAAVCKAWRRVLAAPAFAARYRALHPSAPILGFLHRPVGLQEARLVPTPSTSFRPSPSAVQRSRHPLDCRHGRALFYDYDSSSTAGGFVIWDPVTGDHHSIPEPPEPWASPAVLCAEAAAGCDHRGCGGRGGAFVVAVAGVEDTEAGLSDFHAAFYSSETGRWSMDLYIHLGHKARCDVVEDWPAALVGDSLYSVTESGALLRYRYDLLRRRLGQKNRVVIRDSEYLSVIRPPPGKRLGSVFAMAAEDGGLGLASLCKNSTRLKLWARETTTGGDDGAGQWVQRRVIDLRRILPVRNNPMMRPRLSGIAEDGSAIFVSTEDGVFTVRLVGSSSQARKVSEVGNVDVLYPFMSFYTESLLLKLASSTIAAPVGDHSS